MIDVNVVAILRRCWRTPHLKGGYEIVRKNCGFLLILLNLPASSPSSCSKARPAIKVLSHFKKKSRWQSESAFRGGKITTISEEKTTPEEERGDGCHFTLAHTLSCVVD